jgi:copper(I)-binding protein
MRTPWPAVCGGALVAALGAAGLLRASAAQQTASTPAGPPIVVSEAYVRAPAPPTDAAAAYFTVTNTTGKADRLLSVNSGAGATTVLHTAGMRNQAGGAVIPAHGQLVLSTGKGHVMIEQLFGTLRAGQSVNLELSFESAGEVNVVAPVVALGAKVPPANAGSSA